MPADILDRALNQHGRPHNEADDLADLLVEAYTADGPTIAGDVLDKYIEEERPRQLTVMVAVGRFRQRVEG